MSTAATTTPATAAPVPATPADVSEVSVKKTRRVVDSASVVVMIDDLQKLLDSQIDHLRESSASTSAAKAGGTGVKFLRTVCSRLKQIKKDHVRVAESSTKKTRRVPTANGGFLKPHPVSAEMASFAGWEEGALKSRVDITNAICDYVKRNSLNDPAARKNILPDERLRELLQYDPSVPGNDPLTYFYLQKLIGRLHVKDASKSAPAPVQV